MNEGSERPPRPAGAPGFKPNPHRPPNGGVGGEQTRPRSGPYQLPAKLGPTAPRRGPPTDHHGRTGQPPEAPQGPPTTTPPVLRGGFGLCRNHPALVLTCKNTSNHKPKVGLPPQRGLDLPKHKKPPAGRPARTTLSRRRKQGSEPRLLRAEPGQEQASIHYTPQPTTKPHPPTPDNTRCHSKLQAT